MVCALPAMVQWVNYEACRRDVGVGVGVVSSGAGGEIS